MQTSNLEFNKRPLFSNFQTTFIFPTGELKLFIDIDKKEKIKDMGFQGESISNEVINTWVSNSIGKSINELEAAVFENSFIAWGTLLKRKILEEFKGISPSMSELKKSQLICRCFGVFEEDIKNVFMDNPDAGLRELTDINRAGGGCSTCVGDLRRIQKDTTIISQLEKFSNWKGEGKVPQILGMSPAQFLLGIESKFKKQFGSETSFREFDGKTLSINSEVNLNENDVKEWLESEGYHFALRILSI